MPRRTIADILINQPEDNPARMSMILAESWKIRHKVASRDLAFEITERKLKRKLSQKISWQKRMADPIKREKERLRNLKRDRQKRQTEEGRKEICERTKKSYWKHVEKRRESARRFYQENEKNNKARKEYLKIWYGQYFTPLISINGSYLTNRDVCKLKKNLKRSKIKRKWLYTLIMVFLSQKRPLKTKT